MTRELRAALMGLSAYKTLKEEPLLRGLCGLLDALAAGRGEEGLQIYTDVILALEESGAQGLGGGLLELLSYRESPYPRALAGAAGAGQGLTAAARRDVETLRRLRQLDSRAVLEELGGLLGPEFAPVLAELPRWEAGADFDFEGLTAFYRENGAGLLAQYRAFLWTDGVLIPVAEPDCPDEEEMMGYTLQRDQVIANTRALIEGRRVNDVLLYGDSGTGKSATVKCLLSLPECGNLRLIEVQKEGLRDMPVLIRNLRNRQQKFILFIDDLAFDQDDTTYSVVKTILEGGLEKRPDNVAIYATSNRRLLVRQTFSDREGDEVDLRETIAEKTALSDRFGLRIPYLNLSKPEFLNLVGQLADQAQITMDRGELMKAAVKWDMRVPGRTPRGARQFIASLSLQ